MKKNEIILCDDYAIIKIHNKLLGDFDCLVDKEDLKILSQYYWTLKYDKRHPNLVGYVETHPNKKRLFIHRFLMNPPSGMVVDHINGNTLDNRKNNLKVCTQGCNCKNQTKSKNIYYNKRDDLYIVGFNINRKMKYLCYTRDLEEAQKYANFGRELLKNGKVKQLLSTPCKCIKVPRHNKAGLFGVHTSRNKYQARFKGKYLGTFNTKEEAAQRIKQAENDYHLQNNVW